MKAVDRDALLYELIPYRLQAVDTLIWAYDRSYDFSPPHSLVVAVDGVAILNGNTSAVFNPMIEAGFIHARCLLEFLGLCAKSGRLAAIERRRPDDVGIEHFATRDGHPLEPVSPARALAAYDGNQGEAERALVAIFQLANKGLAHLSSWGSPTSGYTDKELRIACRGIPALIKNNLYIPLGLEMPPALQALPAAHPTAK